MPKKIVIVGGGIIGSAAAVEIARRGFEVVLVEQFDLLHRKGSSHGDSRIIRRTYPSSMYTRLMKEAYVSWSRLESECGSKLVHRSGGIDLLPVESPLLDPLVNGCRENDVPLERIGEAEARDRFGVELPASYAAFVQYDAGVLNASRCLSALHGIGVKMGVEFREQRRLEGLEYVEETGVWRVRLHPMWEAPVEMEGESGLEDEVLDADFVVLCPGAWANSVLKRLIGVELNLRLTKCHVHYVKSRSGEEARAHAMPVFIDYGHWEPEKESKEKEMDVAVYGLPARELEGLIKVASHIGTPLDTIEHRTFDVDPADFSERVRPWLRARLPWVDDSEPVITETCLYTTTPDEDFVIGPLSHIPSTTPTKNIFLACGFSGHGFKLAPVVGRILADFVQYGDIEDEQVKSTFSPARKNLY